VGLAGNLRDYSFVGASGESVTGYDVSYNGSPAGYTEDPQEHIVYVSKHDNETLFDVIQYKAPQATSTADRARLQTLGNSVVMFSQGCPSSRLATICCAPNRWTATATTPATGSTGWTSPTR
jgi:pullulanase